MSVIHAPQDDQIDARQLIVPIVLAGFLLLFLARLFQLQVVQGDDFKERADRESERRSFHLAPRGQILDRNGELLATVKPAWVIQAIPATARKNEKGLAEVAAILETTPEALLENMEGSDKALPTDVFVGATATQAIKIAEARERLDGFQVDVRSMRSVVEPIALTHLLGYVGRPDAKTQERYKASGRPLPDYVGREGLEKQYESELTGVMGESRTRVDSRGRPVLRVTSSETQAIPGSRLTLTIDLELQKTAMRLLGGRKGAVAAIDPRTGEVLALASMPSYDVTKFEGGISRRDYDALRNDPANPFQRRATQGLYSPGSTFKIVTALAAARTGHLDLGHYEFCNGGKRIGSRLFRCNNHPRGMSLDFENAFRLSCNTYFMDLALKAGPEELHKAAIDLGLGSDTGIDLPGENSGRIPSGQDREGRRWYQGDTANFGIGQGDTLVTPLQMAMVACAVANDGVALKPHLVLSSEDPATGKTTPTVAPEAANASAPPGFYAEVREAMRKVVASGTARRAQIGGVEWGGKTGSTQHSGGGKTHSWFVGIAPITNPTIVVAVLAEEAGHGGDVAAPIAAGVVRQWLQGSRERSSEAFAASDRAFRVASNPSARPSAR